MRWSWEPSHHKALALEYILFTHSQEHGIGIGKREFLIKERGDHVVDLMRSIKKVFDPNGILNPGKVFKLAWIIYITIKNKNDVP